MVMISTPRPLPGFLVTDPQGRLLGRIDLPREPDLVAAGTVLLQRNTPNVVLSVV